MNDVQESVDVIKSAKFLRSLRIVSWIEGCSTLILVFIAMPLKYFMNMAQAVSWPGRIHGVLFVLLAVLALIAIKKVPINAKLSLTLIVAAIFPFGPFVVDKKLKAFLE
jgi:integral membrane protein